MKPLPTLRRPEPVPDDQGQGDPTNPHPQESFGDAPNDPRIQTYIAHLVCADTGEKAFEFRYTRDARGNLQSNMGDNWTW